MSSLRPKQGKIRWRLIGALDLLVGLAGRRASERTA